MTEKMFQDFVMYAKEVFGYDVFRTTPEKAIIVGGFYEEKVISDKDYCLSINKQVMTDKFSVFSTNSKIDFAA